MRIALFLTNRVLIPLPQELIFASIPFHLQVAEVLAKRGHSVTVFCSEDSHISEPLVKCSCGLLSSTARKAAGEQVTAKYETAATQLHYAKAYEEAQRNFDIVWAHEASQLVNYAPFVSIPSVFTLHDPLDRPEYSVLPYYKAYPNIHYVSISNAQRVPMPDITYTETIYHGISLEHIPFESNPQPYAVFFGRIIKEKGVQESIDVAQKAGIPIKIIGPLGNKNTAETEYSDAILREVDGKRVTYLGPMTRDQLLPVVAQAKVFINMVNVRESFGMALVESMACGTPVIARNRGSISEVIEHGTTGYVVNTEEEAIQAVSHIDTIDRRSCRNRVENFFSLERCADSYETLFSSLITPSV